MDDGKKGRSKKERPPPRKTSQQNPEDEAAKQQFLENRHDAGREKNGRHFMPEKPLPGRVDAERDQDQAATEQRNRRDQESRRDIGAGSAIFLQTKIAPAAHLQGAQEGPEKDEGGDEQGAMEITFEIKPGQTRQETVRDQELA